MNELTFWEYSALLAEWEARQPDRDEAMEPPSAEEYERGKAEMLARHYVH